MRTEDEEALHRFVASRYPLLRRSALLMCGDWAQAGRVTRDTLAQLVMDSRRGLVADPDAYAWSELMDTLIHRPGRREHLFVAEPGAAGADPAALPVLDALHRLAPRCRAVLILRHWDGLAVDEVADVLGLSDARVEAYESAGLAALPDTLASAHASAGVDAGVAVAG